jgi:carbonic anhydrase
MSECIKDGVANFKGTYFEENQELFEQLFKGQNPHTLFISCSDSRVVPNLLTSSKPGELFALRNIANIVPPHSETDDFLETRSVLDYAVNFLKVKRIVICGHSQCGGCEALHQGPEALAHLPYVAKWLELSKSIPEIVNNDLAAGIKESKALLTEQYNLKLQLQHLLTYPFIEKKVFDGKLQVLALHYTIKTGDVSYYDAPTNSFLPFTE